MELLDVVLRLLTPSTPDNGASLAVDLHHVLFGAFAIPPEDPSKDHRDVAHQVHRVIVHDDKPRQVKRIRKTYLGRIE